MQRQVAIKREAYGIDVHSRILPCQFLEHQVMVLHEVGEPKVPNPLLQLF
jgi:hypothetical protein